MKKVVEVVGSLAVGGAERVALEVAAGLGRRYGEEWRAELWVLGPADLEATRFERSIETEAEKRGVPVRRLVFPSLRDRAARARLGEALRDEAVDLVHVHNRPQDWQVVALCRALGVPVVYTVHLSYPHQRLSTRLLYGAVSRAVPRVVCVSQAVARHVQNVEYVDAGKVRVIYNGIRMDVFAPASAESRAAKRAALGWGDDRFVWLYAARLSEQKGHEYLLQAMARLPSSSRALLALAGNGPREQELKALAAQLSLGERVSFLGARSDVSELLGAADAFASSSRQEGHPLSLLEAMACELPVVAPRLAPIEEIALDGAPVFFGPPIEGWAESHDPQLMAEALLSVELDSRRGRPVAGAMRAHVGDKFSLDVMIDRHAALYGEIVGQAGSRRLGDLSGTLTTWAGKLLGLPAGARRGGFAR